MAINLNDFSAEIHKENSKWWYPIHHPWWKKLLGIAPKKLVRNKGEMLALMHSELSECLEGIRKGKADDHLPHRTSEEVELADLLLRVFDYVGAYKIDIDGAILEKRAYNRVRADHTHEARRNVHGKKF